MKKIENNNYQFESTGRQVYGYGGVFGLCFDDGNTTVYTGHDGTISEVMDKGLRPEERIELADAMIARWQEWKAKTVP